MKATLPKTNVSNGRMLSPEKEQILALRVVAYYKGEFCEPVTVRCWQSRQRNAMTVYASIWADNRKGLFFAGHGRAAGHGYHRASSAMDAALASAGIALDAPIDGRGEEAMIEACSAIAQALGYRRCHVVRL